MYAACVKVYYLYAVPVKILFYVYACILHVLKYTILYAVPAQASEEGLGPPRTGVTDSYKPLCGAGKWTQVFCKKRKCS